MRKAGSVRKGYLNNGGNFTTVEVLGRVDGASDCDSVKTSSRKEIALRFGNLMLLSLLDVTEMH